MKVGCIAFLIVIVIVFAIFGPLVTIWALNLLFGLHIPYTFWTWCASAWMSALVSNQCYKSSSK